MFRLLRSLLRFVVGVVVVGGGGGVLALVAVAVVGELWLSLAKI